MVPKPEEGEGAMMNLASSPPARGLLRVTRDQNDRELGNRWRKKGLSVHKIYEPLSFLCWNLGNTERYDRNSLRKIGRELIDEHKPSICVLGNTGFYPESTGSERTVDGYHPIHEETTQGAAGGLSVYAKKGLLVERIKEYEPTEQSEGWSIILLKIVEKDYLKGENGVGLKDKVTIVCCVLAEGASVPSVLPHIREMLTAVRRDYPGDIPTYVLGTIEAYNSDWLSGTRDTPAGQHLRQVMNSLELQTKSREQTYFPVTSEQGDTVDHVISTQKMRCTVKLLPLRGESGHKPLLVRQEETFCRLTLAGFNYSQDLEVYKMTMDYLRARILVNYQKTGPDKRKKNPHSLGLEIGLATVGDEALSLDEGILTVDTEANEEKEISLSLKNTKTTEAEGIVISAVSFIRKNESFELYDDKGVTKEDEKRQKIRLKPNVSYKVNVKCKANQLGQHKVVIIVLFYHEGLSIQTENDDWLLEWHPVEIHLKINNPELQGIAKGIPYVKPSGFTKWNIEEAVKGDQLTFDGEGLPKKIGRALVQAFIPADRRRVIMNGLTAADVRPEDRETQAKCEKLVLQKLSAANYGERTTLLLQCEEMQMEHDITHYDMSGVTMEISTGRDRQSLLKLRVPGLAENRPSVLKGDKLMLKVTGESRAYEGYVREVGEQDVSIGGVNNDLIRRFIRGMKFDVRFTINRYPLKNMYRAISLVKQEKLLDCLFPEKSMNNQPLGSDLQFSPFNRLISTNPHQMTAIRNILKRSSGPLPYIIFGPPGTGKTITLVEAMKQVLKKEPSARIIAAAPSNAAADLMAERLKEHLQKKQILRYHAPSRNTKTISPKVLDISNIENGEIRQPSKKEFEDLKTFSIIVVTLCNSGKLVTADFPQHHFSHAFIDESGHAMEPEACIPLAGLISKETLLTRGQIVLAGDHLQLGPVLRSNYAKRFGLHMSLLERLMSRDVYLQHAETGFDERYVTKLVRNFRSHPKILELPSRMFYKNELQASADPVLINSHLQFPGIPDKAKGKFPVIFHGVVGKDLREERSPSFFNPEEVVLVLKYVAEVLADKSKVKGAEIGVISPYRRQVEKIREKLRSKGGEYLKVTVGSTEEFQGQERRVMIISTVRSEPEYVKIDRQYKLGFLRNPKRFNVAITRAKSLMIVVGNPKILGQDSSWRQLIVYCQENHGYKGVQYTPVQTDRLTDLEQKMAEMVVKDEKEDAEGSINLIEEPAWRNEV